MWLFKGERKNRKRSRDVDKFPRVISESTSFMWEVLIIFFCSGAVAKLIDFQFI